MTVGAKSASIIATGQIIQTPGAPLADRGESSECEETDLATGHAMRVRYGKQRYDLTYSSQLLLSFARKSFRLRLSDLASISPEGRAAACAPASIRRGRKPVCLRYVKCLYQSPENRVSPGRKPQRVKLPPSLTMKNGFRL